jgi:hypothetical protein
MGKITNNSDSAVILVINGGEKRIEPGQSISDAPVDSFTVERVVGADGADLVFHLDEKPPIVASDRWLAR